jgi:hypothetical protein
MAISRIFADGKRKIVWLGLPNSKTLNIIHGCPVICMLAADYIHSYFQLSLMANAKSKLFTGSLNQISMVAKIQNWINFSSLKSS